MSILSSLFQQMSFCWQRVPSDYELISKKEDDHGIDLATAWIQAHPANPNVSTLSYEKVHAYSQRVFADLKRVPLTSANVEMIGKHLAEISMHSNQVRRYLLDHVFKMGITRPFIKEIYQRICEVYTDKF